MDFTSLKNYPIDFVLIALVILSGIFQKKYFTYQKINGATKTLIVSAGFTIVYALLIKLSGAYSKDLPLKWFFSYVVATSLYEVIYKQLLEKYFPDKKETPVIKMFVLLALVLPLMSFGRGGSTAAANEMLEQSKGLAAVAFLGVFLTAIILAWGILFVHKNTELIKQKLK